MSPETITPPTFDTPVAQQEVSGGTVAPAQSPGTSFPDLPEAIFATVWLDFFLVSLVISIIFAIITLYARIRLYQIRKEEDEYYGSQPLSPIARKVLGVEDSASATGSVHEMRWREVGRLADSENPNDWRQAIVEADIMLDDAITKRGYQGESLGEKMKQVTRSQVNTIDGAWEAHKVRNRIAHEGAAMEISQREVKRIIALFERTLRELGYISS